MVVVLRGEVRDQDCTRDRLIPPRQWFRAGNHSPEPADGPLRASGGSPSKGRAPAPDSPRTVRPAGSAAATVPCPPRHAAAPAGRLAWTSRSLQAPQRAAGGHRPGQRVRAGVRVRADDGQPRRDLRLAPRPGLLAALGVQWAIDLSVIPGLLAAVGTTPRLAVRPRLCWRVGATSWAVIRSARAQPSPPQSDSDVIAFRARREGPAVGVGRVSR